MPGESADRILRTAAAYGGVAAQRLADRPDDRAWVRPLVTAFRALLNDGDLVVDLGCASGRETVELREAGLTVVGLDIVRDALRLGQRRHGATGFVQGSLTRLPFRSESFAGAWACASLLHLDAAGVVVALAEVRRILKPGAALFTSMQRGSRKGWVEAAEGDAIAAPRYYAFYSPAEWEAQLAGAGFIPVETNVNETLHGCCGGAHGWIESYARRPDVR